MSQFATPKSQKNNRDQRGFNTNAKASAQNDPYQQQYMSASAQHKNYNNLNDLDFQSSLGGFSAFKSQQGSMLNERPSTMTDEKWNEHMRQVPINQGDPSQKYTSTAVLAQYGSKKFVKVVHTEQGFDTGDTYLLKLVKNNKDRPSLIHEISMQSYLKHVPGMIQMIEVYEHRKHFWIFFEYYDYNLSKMSGVRFPESVIKWILQ